MFVKSAVTWKDKASLLDIATTTLKNANTHIAGLFCILNMFGLASLVEKLSVESERIFVQHLPVLQS